MPEIKGKIEKVNLTLEQKYINLETEKLLLQHQSLKLQAISLLTILLIAGSLIIQAFAILESTKLDRKQNALSLIAESGEVFSQNESIKSSKLTFYNASQNNNSCLKLIAQQENSILEKNNINNDSCPSEIEIITDRNNIINSLDFLENVALSYKNNIADRSMIETHFKYPAINYISKLDNFIQESEQNNGTKNWQEIVDLVKNWQNEK